MDIDKFVSLVNKELDNIEGIDADIMANLAINMSIKCLDIVAPKKEKKFKISGYEKNYFQTKLIGS